MDYNELRHELGVKIIPPFSPPIFVLAHELAVDQYADLLEGIAKALADNADKLPCSADEFDWNDMPCLIRYICGEDIDCGA